MAWSIRGTKGSFVPLRGKRESAKQKLNQHKEGVGGAITNSAYERSEYATNKSSSDSFSEQEKGMGEGGGKFDGKARRFSVPFISQSSIKGMRADGREETGRLVKETT